MTRARFSMLAVLLLLPACGGGGDRGNGAPTAGFDLIAPEETVRFTGTEPFWGGSIEGKTAHYSTAENVEGTDFPVTRFAGNHGLGFSGTIDGMAWDMTVTPGTCSDGMSDRTYPFTVTLMIGADRREGCAWTESRPHSDPRRP